MKSKNFPRNKQPVFQVLSEEKKKAQEQNQQLLVYFAFAPEEKILK